MVSDSSVRSVTLYILRVRTSDCNEDEGYILAGWYYMRILFELHLLIYKYDALSIVKMAVCL